MTRRSRRRERYRIGITICVGLGGELGLYENGLRQNVIFLHQLFSAAPNCAAVWLVNGGDGEFAGWPSELGIDDVAVVRLADVAAELDYLVVLGAAIAPAELRALRDRGVGLIAYKGGNGAVVSVEASICKPPRDDAERYADARLFDAIWMTPQHMATYAGWCRTVYRVPVHEVPQIWAPTFVDCRAHALGGRFGYRSGARPWRIGILEPNITVMKTSHVPMLVCEAAYRQQPDAIEAVLVTNAYAKKADPHFASFANGLSIVRDTVMSFEQRYVAADFLANHCDAVVTHHWENGLNYLFYEVLYGGYPLVHNSLFLKDFGYYFADFAAEAGGAVLLDAHRRHDASQPERDHARRLLLERLAPAGARNVALHERLLEACAR